MTTTQKSTKTKQELADADERACDLIERKLLACPTCHKKMIRLNQGGSWGCPYGTDHSRVMGSDYLWYEIEKLVGDDGTPDKVIQPRPTKDKKTGKIHQPDPDEKPVVIDGRNVQLDRILKVLETRCGWHEPRWASFYKAFAARSAKHPESSLRVLRVGQWFVSFSLRHWNSVTREDFWADCGNDVRDKLRWKFKLATVKVSRQSVTAKAVYSPFDHDGSVEKKIVAAGIVILN